MKIQEEKPVDPNNSNDLPDHIKRIHEIQRKFSPPQTGEDMMKGNQPDPNRDVAFTPSGMTGPMPPQFGQQPPQARDAALRSTTEIPQRVIPVQQPMTDPVAEPIKSRILLKNKSRPTKPKDELNEKWRRVDLPSNLVPYARKGITEIFLRPFTVNVLEEIYDSITAKNHIAYIDALDHCINMDIRDLTIPDYVFVQYWLRLTSYTRSPYTVKWTSRYGNDHSSVVKQTDLEIVYLNMTVEMFEKWREQGVTFPTVREAEYSLSNDLEDTPESTWLLQNAQYINIEDEFDGDRMAEKIRRLRESDDPDILAAIQDFASECEHGIIEQIKISDTMFKPQEAIKYLRDAAENLRMLAKAGAEQDADAEDGRIENTAGILVLAERAEEHDAEADAIQAALDAGQTYKPREEVVVLRSIQPTDMFPSNYQNRNASNTGA